MMTFLLGYVAGGLSLFLVWAGASAYREVRARATPPAMPASPADAELTLLRQGLATQEMMYRENVASGLLLLADRNNERAAELRQKIAALEAR